MTNDLSRHPWYQDGARALTKALPYDAVYGYACPLCLRIVPPEEAHELSLEHVPPRRVGGKRLVLTCKQCNNDQGSRLDSHAVLVEQVRKLTDGQMTAEDRPIPAEQRINNGHVIRAKLTNTGDGIRPVEPPRVIPPLPDGTTSIRLSDNPNQWTLPEVDTIAAFYSYLRAAYLVAFAALGYRYILGYELFRPSDLDELRRRIVEPIRSLTTVPYVVAPKTPREYRYLFVALEPPDLHHIRVRIGELMLFLPGFDSDDGFFERLEDSNFQDALVDRANPVIGSPIPWPIAPVYRVDLDLTQSPA